MWYPGQRRACVPAPASGATSYWRLGRVRWQRNAGLVSAACAILGRRAVALHAGLPPAPFLGLGARTLGRGMGAGAGRGAPPVPACCRCTGRRGTGASGLTAPGVYHSCTIVTLACAALRGLLTRRSDITCHTCP
ncbi:hypothetical protein EMIHUDRAFT_450912 [Emiliania huxleyi CCMP1516]|uniref:Uncharacterized protein n=2 Tax=Emiliania huxleyi TaxID=2903 RepID=A0A0D3JA62_EMIH1|nr:hypothetical protein EMIHUDRAFT_450912 [Emiliania huxleyi CCMP1516]EOD20397.1 hypothetical protein EMIHUDRAFT_450912 [Emiliania huxleyi CCMP1516]|eukprot:XP_005772826.1 hypothetical protein EMIHUDRAFT_450912 [Emiliania huxleyi CCMP1516]